MIRRLLLVGLFVLVAAWSGMAQAAAERNVDVDLRTDAVREKTVSALKERSEARKQEAEAVILGQGGRIRGKTPDGTFYELMAIKDGKPVYYITHNANAAISTATDLIRNTAPYNLNGAGLTIGLWEEGAPRLTHQEFVGRINLIDVAGTGGHATYVAGTIGAAGVVGNALGMAPSVTIDSYQWLNDTSEMASRGATIPGEAGKIYLSNHSYGFAIGWIYGDWSGSYGPHWWGTPGDREDDVFGRYDTDYSQEWDEICYAAPYYLPFKSASNDRDDAAPSTGTTFYYGDVGGWQSKTYNPATDPYGDGWDNGGYDNLDQVGVAKNIMTVGSVNDAVTGGVRKPSKGTCSSFSSWGPTDDGRIKPDIMANGASLYTCGAGADNDYTSQLGTSMSTPNASGSSVLLIEYYDDLFPGDAMRSSMLKGLILHTATDLGNAGPDYSYGWGLMDTKTAADHIKVHSDYPSAKYMEAGLLKGDNPSDRFTFVWDDTTPIRVTVCWTDPAGPGQTGLDDPTPMLVNDLDLRIYGPGGSPTYMPYILDRLNPSDVATTGDNTVDNVEQVYIASPGASGTYTVEVTHKGTLTNGEQYYSLLLNGQSPDNLSIIPSDDFYSAGPEGGPFTPPSKVYTLSNIGAGSLNWTASKTVAWLDDPSPASGTIAAGGPDVDVLIAINANADAFSAGHYNDTVTFSNTTSSAGQAHDVFLEVRPVDAFTWNTVSSPQMQDVPFGVGVTAVDSEGETVTTFAGTVDLKGVLPVEPITIGTGVSTWDYPLMTFYHDARTQVIYLASEIGTAMSITSLALDVSVIPLGWGESTMSNWTIRVQHTPLSSYTNASWEGSGWTTVYQNNETITSTGWVTFDFTTPFDYNGTDNLMVDFSFNNESWREAGSSTYSSPGGNRSLYFRADSNEGDPLTWSGTSNPTPSMSTYVPNIRLSGEGTVAIAPVVSGSFVSGVWNGDVTVLEQATGMYLNADDASGLVGDSNPFSVLAMSGVDTDGDGMPDWWENLYYGGPTNAIPTDICSNGINTVLDAYIAGLNPADSNSQFKISILSDTVQWPGVSGRVYSVWSTTNLLDSFLHVETNIPWTENSYTNVTADPSRYYKVDVKLEE